MHLRACRPFGFWGPWGVAPRGILLMILHGVYIKLNLIRHFTEAYFIEFSSHPNHCTVILEMLTIEVEYTNWCASCLQYWSIIQKVIQVLCFQKKVIQVLCFQKKRKKKKKNCLPTYPLFSGHVPWSVLLFLFGLSKSSPVVNHFVMINNEQCWLTGESTE